MKDMAEESTALGYADNATEQRIREWRKNRQALSAYRARKAVNRAVSPKTVERIAKRMADMALESTDERAAIDAAKFLFGYAIGKPKQEIEVNETTTYTMEQRRTLIMEMLGVSPDDATLRFGTRQDQQRVIADSRNGPVADATPLLPRPVEVHRVGEVPPSGSDVGERPAEREATPAEGQAAGSPVLISGPPGGE